MARAPLEGGGSCRVLLIKRMGVGVTGVVANYRDGRGFGGGASSAVHLRRLSLPVRGLWAGGAASPCCVRLGVTRHGVPTVMRAPRSHMLATHLGKSGTEEDLGPRPGICHPVGPVCPEGCLFQGMLSTQSLSSWRRSGPCLPPSPSRVMSPE